MFFVHCEEEERNGIICTFSITARANRGVTCCEREGRWSCIIVSGDQGCFVEASGSGLKLSERRGSRSGEDPEEVRTSE